MESNASLRRHLAASLSFTITAFFCIARSSASALTSAPAPSASPSKPPPSCYDGSRTRQSTVFSAPNFTDTHLHEGTVLRNVCVHVCVQCTCPWIWVSLNSLVEQITRSEGRLFSEPGKRCRKILHCGISALRCREGRAHLPSVRALGPCPNHASNVRRYLSRKTKHQPAV